MIALPHTLHDTRAAITIDRLEVFLFRVPLDKPRVNSFGRMPHRTALVVRLIDKGGAEGWGECFSNWPAFGAEHRFRILADILGPSLTGRRFTHPAEVAQDLARETRVLRLQTDERGPFDQTVAAIDVAAWDLASRRAEVPLYRMLGGPERVEGVPYYSSGISPDQAVAIARQEVANGARALKCKVGFGADTDIATLAALRDFLGPEARLMADANQKWDMPAAREAIRGIAQFGLDWIEEPIGADHPASDFAELAELGVPIAAGENIRGVADFDTMMSQGRLSVVQPDIIKWGGITGCHVVARRAVEAGLRYCPHYLGGGVGLMASAHLLAAVGGDGLLEMDASPNPLRLLLADPFPDLVNGVLTLPESPGIGVRPDLDALAQFRIEV